MEKPPRVFSSQNLERFAQVFAQHRVEYLIIGKSGAIVYGFPDTTQDLDIFPEKTQENSRRLISALKELGFPLNRKLEEAICQGKDFIQLRGDPFDLDLVFAPDGIESFREAKERGQQVEGKYPVAAMEDIIKSKRIASRQKDREVLHRLEAFAKYLKGKRV